MKPYTIKKNIYASIFNTYSLYIFSSIECLKFLMGCDVNQPNTKRNHANNPLEVPIGPITIARVKKLKEASNGLV